VDLLIANIKRTELKYESYVSVVTCREVLEYYETSYFGEYDFVFI